LAPPHTVYLEVGNRRVFAGAIDWPGWCRSGRDEETALRALVDYGPRYKAALGRAAAGFASPSDPSALTVVERLQGNATTDFGAPDRSPTGDDRPVNPAEANRLASILKAIWAQFDESAEAAKDKVLRKGPRGGGRELDAIVRHVIEAEGAYLSRLGVGYREADASGLRKAVLDTLEARVRGDPLPPSRRTAPLWTPRRFVRRSAWHALDHAWEIEDRAGPG
jgi:hypothetical protein